VIGPDANHGRLFTPVAAGVAERAKAHVVILHPAAGPLASTQRKLAA
jgi:hypothetical protein